LKQRSTRFNPKRRLLAPGLVEARLGSLRQLGEQVRYGGNPAHKRSPGDFGLLPPAAPRAGKSLCDDAGVVTRREALGLLRAGLAQGLVSDRFAGDWPYNVWMVTAQGIPLEAQWEGPGIYHGYPMPEADPFRDVVLAHWNERRG
jgi:hypothetical protein